MLFLCLYAKFSLHIPFTIVNGNTLSPHLSTTILRGVHQTINHEPRMHPNQPKLPENEIIAPRRIMWCGMQFYDKKTAPALHPYLFIYLFYIKIYFIY